MIDGTPQQALLDREPDAQILDLQQRCRLLDLHRPTAGLGREQFLGVRMLGRTEQFFTQRLFDDTTALHDTYAMGDPPNQVEIVADQQQRHAQPRLQFLSSSRIFSCTVTSSAVVGSSAISSSGSLARAMAIITRWRWPPDSSCG